MIRLATIVAELREMRRMHPNVDAVVRVDRGDDRFAWGDLCSCSDGGLPGLDVGQHQDCRLRTERRDGMHVHVFPDRVEMHLDRIDPLVDPLGHVLADTAALEGLIKGAGIGAVLALVTKDAKYLAVAAALGGAIGATRPARRPLVVSLSELLAA